ncbi:MAG: hypothetical protein U0325_04925 [Polyangiales bacterium]
MTAAALPAPPPRAARLAALLLVAGLMLAAWRLGLLGAFSDPARARAAVLGMGALGQVGFVLAYAVLQPFGVPGTAFILAAALIWPWTAAFGLSMAGTMAASVLGFVFARFVARDWVAARVPARFHAWDDALARRGFATVFVLRLIFWMPRCCTPSSASRGCPSGHTSGPRRWATCRRCWRRRISASGRCASRARCPRGCGRAPRRRRSRRGSGTRGVAGAAEER